MAAADHTGRNVVLLGGAGLFTWWLLSRGKGWGFRGLGGDADGKLDGDATSRPTRVVVWIRSTGLAIDGVAADLPTVVARSRDAGTAEVHATGAAITHVVRDVLSALVAANVQLVVPPDLAPLVPSSRVVS